MPCLPPNPNVPPISAPAPSKTLQDFLVLRIVPITDPELQEALRRTWEGSPSFRESLTALFEEQPKIKLELVKIDSESLGFLTLAGDPEIYPLRIAIQWRGVIQRRDLPEPWIASILFALLEITRRDSVIPRGPSRYHFNENVQSQMWAFQAKVRKELKKHDPERYRALARNGELLYYNFFPSRPRRPGM